MSTGPKLGEVVFDATVELTSDATIADIWVGIRMPSLYVKRTENTWNTIPISGLSHSPIFRHKPYPHEW